MWPFTGHLDLNYTGLHSVDCSPSPTNTGDNQKTFQSSFWTGHVQEMCTSAGVCQCDVLNKVYSPCLPGTRMWPLISIDRGIVGVRLAGVKGSFLGR